MARFQLHLNTEDDDDETMVVTAIGEVDVASVEPLGDFIAELDPATIVFDLRYVSFFGAVGVDLLVSSLRRRPTQVLASFAVRRVLELCDAVDEVRPVPVHGRPRLDEAPFAFAEHDRELRFVYLNRMLAELNGRPIREHLGMRGDELFDCTVDGVTPVLERVVSAGTPTRCLVEGSTGSGSSTWTCDYVPVHYPELGGAIRRGVAAVVLSPEAAAGHPDPDVRTELVIAG